MKDKLEKSLLDISEYAANIMDHPLGDAVKEARFIFKEADHAYKLLHQLEEPQQEKAVVPAWFEEWDEEAWSVQTKFYLLSRVELGFYFTADPSVVKDEYSKYTDYVRENFFTLARALTDGDYDLKTEEKTYRFTLNAYHEIDVEAKSYEEAEEKAQENWDKTFGNIGTFGGAEFEEEVTEC